MVYVKVRDTRYPAVIGGKMVDADWDGRESKAITLEMSHAEAMSLFVDDLDWAIVCENGELTETFDNSDFSIAGPVADNRDGTVTVKMGKPTDAELLAIIMGG